MLNRCEFIGNLAADPEVKSFQNGDKVANIRLGVSERWKDKQTGEKKERTEWVSAVLRGGLVGVVEQYTRKGSKLFIAGKMATRKWQDRDGNDKYTTEIYVNELVLLDSKGAGESDNRHRNQNGMGTDHDLSDEIPF
ncbi:single-stranded DNA-binding protein [Sphingopyxis sp. C-1]|uniref:single-stranded DNA-binding protein n=1 Tax=Sphingopyxis sp. C-1 TaxID=262667 RepID=UPI0006C5BC8F|nr:single-stranded DNA-binding protein [Sphingopyxis sp. C-1]GAO78682.1 single-stranded DNA-binding protein [Sphingopyxis sp. C-1]